MTHTPETVRALVIGETLAVQVVAMRQQRIGGRAFAATLITSEPCSRLSAEICEHGPDSGRGLI